MRVFSTKLLRGIVSFADSFNIHWTAFLSSFLVVFTCIDHVRTFLTFNCMILVAMSSCVPSLIGPYRSVFIGTVKVDDVTTCPHIVFTKICILLFFVKKQFAVEM